jgi:hypothetical protein
MSPRVTPMASWEALGALRGGSGRFVSCIRRDQAGPDAPYRTADRSASCMSPERPCIEPDANCVAAIDRQKRRARRCLTRTRAVTPACGPHSPPRAAGSATARRHVAGVRVGASLAYHPGANWNPHTDDFVGR